MSSRSHLCWRIDHIHMACITSEPSYADRLLSWYSPSTWAMHLDGSGTTINGELQYGSMNYSTVVYSCVLLQYRVCKNRGKCRFLSAAHRTLHRLSTQALEFSLSSAA